MYESSSARSKADLRQGIQESQTSVPTTKASTRPVALHNFSLSLPDFVEFLLDSLFNEDLIFEYEGQKLCFYSTKS